MFGAVPFLLWDDDLGDPSGLTVDSADPQGHALEATLSGCAEMPLGFRGSIGRERDASNRGEIRVHAGNWLCW
jgi:hypothetical protein